MKSSCVITFEGLNINRLLNDLCRKGFSLLAIERQGKICKIQVPSSQSAKVVALLREKCYNIQNIRYKGRSAVGKFVKKRFVLPIAAVIMVILLAFSSRICWKIEVQGDFDTQIVLDALSSAGVRRGANLSKLNVDKIENSVANSIGAMYAVVNVKGSVVYVNVVANKQIDPPIDMNKRRDIVATQSGVVTGVLCEQGVALVKVGDSVQAGDVLIEGKRIFNDGTSRDVYALGKVTVELSTSGFAEFNGYRTVIAETGNTYKKVSVKLFGNEYGAKCKYENFTAESASVRLYPLNLEVITNVYRETREVTVAATIEESLEELKSKAYSEALSGCDYEIKDVRYNIADNGVQAVLIGYAEFY